MKYLIVFLLLILGGCSKPKTIIIKPHIPKLQVGDCYSIPRNVESWEEQEEKIYQILKVGNQKYLYRFKAHSEEIGEFMVEVDTDIMWLDSVAVLKECPGYFK